MSVWILTAFLITGEYLSLHTDKKTCIGVVESLKAKRGASVVFEDETEVEIIAATCKKRDELI